jgi:succinate-acetate transporter protein
MFWLSLVALIALPHAGLGLTGPSGYSIPAYLAAWGVFTLVLFIGTLRLNRALQVVFATLTILFFMLAAGDVLASAAVTKAAGWVGLVCGASAIYTGLAQVLNEVYGKTVWPLGPVARG